MSAARDRSGLAALSRPAPNRRMTQFSARTTCTLDGIKTANTEQVGQNRTRRGNLSGGTSLPGCRRQQSPGILAKELNSGTSNDEVSPQNASEHALPKPNTPLEALNSLPIFVGHGLVVVRRCLKGLRITGNGHLEVLLPYDRHPPF